jgi:hypothetical protein|tara:strand:+ start:363 stop:596 length:234 start_codon:yes stop_codon:yes gene_type:complete
MNKEKISKGFNKVFWTIILCFIAPVIVSQAFKNEGHSLYWPVLIIGVVLLLLTIWLGYKGVSTLVDGLLDDKKKKQD